MSIQADSFPVPFDQVCAAQNQRSFPMHTRVAGEKYLQAYEKEHGEIPLPKEE